MSHIFPGRCAEWFPRTKPGRSMMSKNFPPHLRHTAAGIIFLRNFDCSTPVFPLQAARRVLPCPQNVSIILPKNCCQNAKDLLQLIQSLSDSGMGTAPERMCTEMEEKENLTTPEAEENTAPVMQDEAPATEPVIEEDAEEKPRLYFGRFTPGVWRGGVLGIALGYILLGIFGLINHKLGLNLDKILANPGFKYGLMLVLMYILGKVGGIIERRNAENGEE